MVRALIVRKLLGREFQREIAEYMGERGIRLVFGFGRRIRLLVLGRREFDLSGFVRKIKLPSTQHNVHHLKLVCLYAS